MKKLLALLLSAIMVLSLCPAGVAGQELTTITILTKNDFDSEHKTADWEKYDVSQVLIAKLAEMGIRLEFECIDNASFAEVVRTRMAAGVDLPDIISVSFEGGLGSSEIIEWGQNGLIIPASELMEKYDEDGSIKAFYNTYVPSALASNTAADGNLYWFSYLYGPQMISQETGEALPPYGYRTPSIRQDWVEKVGGEMKITYTPDELFELLKKIQDEDANGNGLKDEVVCIPIDQFDNGIADGFGLGIDMLCYVGQNDEVQSNFYNENFPAYLEFMHKLYENGLYDTAAFGADLFSGELITQNKASVTTNYATWGDYEKQIGVEGAQYTPFVLTQTGDLANGWKSFGDVSGGTYNQYFVTSACKNPEAVTKLFDFVYTLEYAMLDMGGVEGVAYSLDANGVIEYLSVVDPSDPDYEIKTANFALAAGLYALPAIVVLPMYQWEVDPSSEEYLQVKQRVVAELNQHTDSLWFDGGTKYAQATDEERERAGEISGVLTTYAKEMLTDMILGNRPISDLDDCIKEMESLGLGEYIEIMTARHARYVEATK